MLYWLTSAILLSSITHCNNTDMLQYVLPALLYKQVVYSDMLHCSTKGLLPLYGVVI